MNRFVTAVRRKGRWVSKIKHPNVCAVISIASLATVARAEQILGFPTYNAWRTSPDFPRGAA